MSDIKPKNMYLNTSKNNCGFGTANVDNATDKNSFLINGLDAEASFENDRLILVSSVPKVFRTNNRKKVSQINHIDFLGNACEVNSKKSGLYIPILDSMFTQLSRMIELCNRVFVFRFDLHLPNYTDDNSDVSKFIKKLFKQLKKEYGFKNIGYCWVREQEKSKSQHYHFVLFLDGRKIQHSSKIMALVKQHWKSIGEGFHAPYIPKPFYNIDKNSNHDDVTYRLSYLAKTRGKGYRPSQTKDFSCSRIKIKN